MSYKHSFFYIIILYSA